MQRDGIYVTGARRMARQHDRLQAFVKVWIGIVFAMIVFVFVGMVVGGVMVIMDPHGFMEWVGSLFGAFIDGTGLN